MIQPLCKREEDQQGLTDIISTLQYQPTVFRYFLP